MSQSKNATNSELIDSLQRMMLAHAREELAIANFLSEHLGEEFPGLDSLRTAVMQESAKERIDGGQTLVDTARLLGVSRATMYRLLKEEKTDD